LGAHATDLQKAKILERSNTLRRKIDAWITIHQLYIPAVALLRTQDDSAEVAPVAVQDIKLYLPSSLSTRVSLQVSSCSILFIQHEWDFRYAQAQETLNELRGFLLLYSHMLKSKDRHIRGQRLHTRSIKLLSDVESKIQGSASKYRRIWTALEALSLPLLQTTWKKVLQPLVSADVTGLSSMDDSQSEGRKKLSWIWKVHGTGANVDDCTEAGKPYRSVLLLLLFSQPDNLALRIEWCKARARAHRWQEECLLLSEEMRRILAFFIWQENEWRSRAKSIPSRSDNVVLAEGKVAYALRQANIRSQMVESFKAQWNVGQLEMRLTATILDGRDPYVMVECH
jgi:hypothetical protein